MGRDVLIIGSGGREHALAWKLSQSPGIGKIYASPGNAGLELMDVECLPYSADDLDMLAYSAFKQGIDLTVVGPEEPLAEGIVDLFQRRCLRVFGPCREAARIESSKIFAKNLMTKRGIPTAGYRCFSDYKSASRFVVSERSRWPAGGYVVKADGLAGGKGVSVCDTWDQAVLALDEMMNKKKYGKAGSRVLIEDRLSGPEASFIALSDSERVMPFPPVRDYKRSHDGDQGENTGGMGSVSPVHWADGFQQHVEGRVLRPAVDAMRAAGSPFRGALYAGEMLSGGEPNTLEFNCRFGDPEAQVLMMRLKSDLLPYLLACADGSLEGMPPLEFDERSAVCVVFASGGYPDQEVYKKNLGERIEGLKEVEKGFSEDSLHVFHAGTKLVDNGVYTAGGRVLGVTALGYGIHDAAELAYEAAVMLEFEGRHYRKDIGSDLTECGPKPPILKTEYAVPEPVAA